MSIKEIETDKFDVNLVAGFFLRILESKRLPTFMTNGKIGIPHRDKIPPIKR